MARGRRRVDRSSQDLLCARISAPVQSGGGFCHFWAMAREPGQLFLSALESRRFDTQAMLESAGRLSSWPAFRIFSPHPVVCPHHT